MRRRILAAIERIANAEAAASGVPRPPEITTIDQYPLNVNNQDAAKRVADAFRGHFGAERVRETGPAPASEDFGSFGSEWHVPSVFWFVGGTDPETYAKAKEANKINELLVDHSPKFAPVLHPTLRTGIEHWSSRPFVLSGALAGARRELDLFGVLVLSFAAGNSVGSLATF